MLKITELVSEIKPGSLKRGKGLDHTSRPLEAFTLSPISGMPMMPIRWCSSSYRRNASTLGASKAIDAPKNSR